MRGDVGRARRASRQGGARGRARPRPVASASGLLNEKTLVERSGLAALHERFTRIPAGRAALVEWVGGLRRALDAV